MGPAAGGRCGMEALCGARVFTGEATLEEHALLHERGRVAGLLPEDALPNGARVRQLEGGLLAPGFVDVQVNGGGGVLFGEPASADTIRALATAHRRFGTTACLPTLVSAPRETVRAAMEAVRNARARPAEASARVLGIHVEGPHLASERCGAHDPARLRPAEEADLALYAALGEGRTVVTLAPECVPAGSVRRLAGAGVLVCAGHTQASYAEVRAALGEGLRGFTHLWNAMRPPAGREPGVVGAALDDPASYCGVIADGHHVHPASLRLALRAKPRGRLFLVTDAMPPVGAAEPDFHWSHRRMRVRDGRCETEDGTLAGSVLDMASAVRNATAELGLPLEEALRMASAYPAAFLGLEEELGRLAPGLRADLVWLDDALRVRETWVDGIPARA